MIEQIGLKLLHQFDPEQAHGVALRLLNSPLAPRPGPVTSTRLRTVIAGLELNNPVGLAAGFDKNATAVAPLMRAGFGFIEVGAATPRPQAGNAKPRLFRLTEDNAAINRFGFNNDGMMAISERLSQRPKGIPVGINLGANKDSGDRAADFGYVLDCIGPYVDFATVNVSSPNTEKLRDLQGADALAALLAGVMRVRKELSNPIPVFLKISPDLTGNDIIDIATVALEAGVDAIIATNTTLDRNGLQSPHATEMGGLSGAPLFNKSTQVLAAIFAATQGKIPLIGVGGVSSAEDAYEKICAGASAVQLYTAMVYKGVSLGANVARGLDRILETNGHATISDAVGRKVDQWLR